MEDSFTLNTYKPVSPYGQKKKGVNPFIAITIIIFLSTLAALISYFLISGKSLTLDNFNFVKTILSQKPASLPEKEETYVNPFIEDQFTINPFNFQEPTATNIFDQFDTNIAVVNNNYENPFQ